MVIENEVRPQLLNIREVATMLHIHTNTLRQWTNKGLIKAYRIGKRGDRRFDPDDIIKFMNSSVERNESAFQGFIR